MSLASVEAAPDRPPIARLKDGRRTSAARGGTCRRRAGPTAHRSPQASRAQHGAPRCPPKITGPMEHWAGYNRPDGALGRLRSGLGRRGIRLRLSSVVVLPLCTRAAPRVAPGEPPDVPVTSRSRVRCSGRRIMADVSRVVTIAIVLAVVAACSLILLHVFRGHGQNA